MSESSPSFLLDCEDQAFGTLLALEMKHKRRLTPAAQEIIRNLRENITHLIESPAEHDAQVVQSINDNFYQNDRIEYNSSEGRGRRMGEQGILQWLAQASDKEFLALARWNVERRESLRDKLEEDRDDLIGAALAKADRLVDIGLFPIEALDSINQAVRYYSPFSVMDSFESGAMQARGYFDTETISIANLYTLPYLLFDISEELESTVFHELLHAAGYTSGKGFHFNDTPLNGRLWEEAFIAHSTAVAQTEKKFDPQPEVYDPTQRIGITDFTYSDERQIMGHLSSPDIANVPVDLWADAFFDDTDGRHQRRLVRKLRLGFRAICAGEDAFDTFNKAYEETWSPYDTATRSQLLESVDKQVYQFRGIEVETLS